MKRIRLSLILCAGLFGLMPLAGVAKVAGQASAPVSGKNATPAANSAAAAEGEQDETAEYRHSKTVQAIGKAVGLDAEHASKAFEWLNFIVLAALVGGFLVKALPKVFRNRTSALQKHLVDARTAQEEASARMSSIEDRLGQLDGQIEQMRADAERNRAAEESRMRAAVEEEKGKILAAAEAEIRIASQQAQRDLQRHAAELAIDQAASKLVISAETDRLLVRNFAQRLGSGEMQGGGN